MQKQGEKSLFLSNSMGRLYKTASITQNRICGNNEKTQTTTKNTVKYLYVNLHVDILHFKNLNRMFAQDSYIMHVVYY